MSNNEDVTRLEKVYLETAHETVRAFYGTIRSDLSDREDSSGNLVGLLTFPNSGTSWFLRLSQIASGIRNHTAYEHEAIKVNGGASRGVYILNSPNERTPQDHEPSLVKSHVDEYGEKDVTRFNYKNVDDLVGEWKKYLPPNCSRHIRLVRNPFDNMRARFHLYLKLNADCPEQSLLNFRQFFQQDLRRYLLWHAYCDRVADDYPMMSLHYSNLLDKEKAYDTFLGAMRFAGYNIDMQDVERAFKTFPPVYPKKRNLPVHLQYYSEDDIHWMVSELDKWLKLYAKLLSPNQGLTSIIGKLLRQK